MKKRLTRKGTLALFAGFALLAAALRFHSFFLSVIDSDESLYLLMADALTKGHLPYTVIFDNKPPGVYFILAGALKFVGWTLGRTFGDAFAGIFAMRLVTVLFSAGTACILYEIAGELWQNARAGIFAGLFFCIYSTVNGGLAANTEPFFIFFAAAGMLVALRTSRTDLLKGAGTGVLCLFTAGLLFGIAFQIKFLAAFDMAAIGALLFFRSAAQPVHADLPNAPQPNTGRNRLEQDRRYRGQTLRVGGALFAGFVLPSIAVAALFFFTGHFGQYTFSNFTANMIRARVSPFSSAAFFAGLTQQAEMFPLVWLTFFAAFFGCLFFLFKSWTIRFCTLWAVLDLVSIAATKKYYPHYYLQILPPLCLLGGYGFSFLLNGLSAQKRGRLSTADRIRLGGKGAAVIVVAFLTLPLCWAPLVEGAAFVDHRWIRREKNAGDPAAAVADDVRARLAPGQWPFVVNADPIVYFLVGANAPSRFLFPPFLTGESELDQVAGIDGALEIKRMMSLGPQVVLYSPVWKGRTATLDAFSDALDQRYARVAEISGVMIYRKLP